MAMCSALWFMFGFSFVFGDSLGGVIGNPATYAGYRNLDKECLARAPHIPALSYAMFQVFFFC